MLPDCAATAIVWSLPKTFATTIVIDSMITGLTFPGMIELPGWTSGRMISPRPARGPEANQRRSLPIFHRLTATVRSAPAVDSTTSRLACAWKWLSVSFNRSSVRRLKQAQGGVDRGGCCLERLEGAHGAARADQLTEGEGLPGQLRARPVADAGGGLRAAQGVPGQTRDLLGRRRQRTCPVTCSLW